MQTRRRICVRGLIYKDGKIFGQKLNNTTGGWWSTPGGGVEPMETLLDALRREMVEETGKEPVVGRLVLVQQYATQDQAKHGYEEKLEFFFLIENPEDYEEIILKNTSHGAKEVAEYGFVDPVKGNVLPKILQTPDVIKAIEGDQSVIFYTKLD